jgi:glycosyltransferase involved in cell wall biosynthesis
MVRPQRNDIMFVWVSPALPTGAVADRVESFELGDVLHLIRSEDVGKERQDILKFFGVADMFALPSYVEGVPIALLEAMAMGLQCVSTNVYGIPEAIINEETGLLIEAGDADALAEAILRLANDEQLRRKLGKAGRQHAMTKFDERVAAKTAVAAYLEAVASEG